MVCTVYTWWCSQVIFFLWLEHDGTGSVFITTALNICLNDAAAMVTHQVAQSARCSAGVGAWRSSYSTIIASNTAYSCMFTHEDPNIFQYRGDQLFLINCLRLCLYICTRPAHLPLFPLMQGRTFEYSLSLSLKRTGSWDVPCSTKATTLHLEPHLLLSKAHLVLIYKLYLM